MGEEVRFFDDINYWVIVLPGEEENGPALWEYQTDNIDRAVEVLKETKKAHPHQEVLIMQDIATSEPFYDDWEEPDYGPKEMDSPPSNFPYPVNDGCECGIGYNSGGHLPGCSALRD